MKVLRLHGRGDLRLHDEPAPRPGDGEERVRVTAVGLCGSDLHWFDEGGIGDDRLGPPLVLGHEFAGVVADGPRGGLRVAVDPAVPCNACPHCEEGNPNFCDHIRFAGNSTTDGALRTEMAWPSRALFPLPDALSDADGALLEPLGVALHAGDLGHLRPGMSVGVFGCGPIGLLMLQVARAAGAARLFATDCCAHRLEAAERCGATDLLQAEPGGGEGLAVWAATGGRGVDVAFEAAGANDAVEAAIAAARPGARVVLIGIPSDDRTSFSASQARRKGLTLMLTRRMKHTYPRAIALVERGLVDLGALVSHTYPLEAYEAAFGAALRREGLKIVVTP